MILSEILKARAKLKFGLLLSFLTSTMD